MNGLYRLLNVESLRMLKVAGGIGAVLIGSHWFMIRSALIQLHEYSVLPRFEDVYSTAGGAVLFWAGLIAVLAWFAISFYAHYWGSKSIYTLLTLPVARSSLHVAKLISLISGIAILLCAQLVSVLLAFSMYEDRIKSFKEPLIMANGLFLAFIRSDFFRLLFPLSLEGVLHGIVLWITMATMLHYAILCERSRKYWGFIPTAAAGYCLFKLIQIRMADPLRLPYDSMTTDTVYSVILLLLNGYFIWHGLRWIQRGAIA